MKTIPKNPWQKPEQIRKTTDELRKHNGGRDGYSPCGDSAMVPLLVHMPPMLLLKQYNISHFTAALVQFYPPKTP
jgi:hypothetical protein